MYKIFLYPIIFFASYYLAQLLDRYVTSNINKLPLLLVGRKTSYWILRPAVLTLLPFLAIFYSSWSSSTTKEQNSLIFLFFLLYSIFLVVFNGSREYIGTAIESDEHKNWAKNNGFVYSQGVGWTTRYSDVNYYLTLGSLKAKWQNSEIIPSECSIIIRTKNPTRRSFFLPVDSFELWTKIGAEHLELVKANKIYISATGNWFMVKIKFAELEKVKIDKIFELMNDSLKEIKYRLGAGFDYKPF